MPTLVPLDNLLGAILIGLVLSSILYGVSCLQVYLYYTQYCKNDSLRLKLFVSLVVALDSLHLALISSAYYHYTVTNYGDYLALEQVTWTIVVQISIGGLVGLLVQLFFATRLYFLGKRKLLIPGLVCFLGVVELGCSIAYTVVAFKDHYYSASGQEHHGDAYTSTALTANIVCDLLIAGTTVYYLQEGRTAFHRTNKAVTLLMTYALSTCVLAILNSRETVRRAFEEEITSHQLTSFETQAGSPNEGKGSAEEETRAMRPSSHRLTPNTTLPVYRLADDGRASGRLAASLTSTAV
ncbi:uncharacterized protein C8Q71DRAFT_859479 [Rhodofomes roseus]|uniref:Uncharacterized protein n=1 Tax=Rhodofomes roseus TaxID=34475 RepID=A0ABQ8KAJ2_9APHY|nr:uncharacterized protein C8Q71DRAFT_859479 [Rhodofomes roseus]KAH9834485.1 hypothetical protein C8Q71DRAFT_859479 [Rhodofomes roseus]